MLKYRGLLIAFLFLSTAIAQDGAVSVDCDTSSLYGQAQSADKKSAQSEGWAVEVIARKSINKEFLKREVSYGEWYCIKIPTPLSVYLVFNSPGYKPHRSDWVDTSVESRRHSWPLKVVILHPIVAGSLLEPQGENVAVQSGSQGVRDKLEIYKETISPSGPNDVFIWNIELYKNLYRNDPDATAQINQFIAELKADPQYSRLIDADYESKANLFRFVIARNQGVMDQGNVRPAELVSLINNPAIFPDIRAETMRATATLRSLLPDEKEQLIVALVKLLERDGSAQVRVKAVEVLGAIADQPEVLTALRKAAQEDVSPQVKAAASAAAELVASRPVGSPISSLKTHVATTTRTSQTVQNADGTWTVIEYPIGKEVTVDLTPGTTLASAKGLARVMRVADHTMINLDLSGLTSASQLNLYAVDPLGKVTLLGPVKITNGAVMQSFHTPLNRFMLVLSPEANLTTIAATTHVLFRSAVPQGFAVVPLASTDHEDGAPVGEKVSAVATSGGTSAYSVPMLNIPGMARGEDTKMKVNLTGELTGARVNFNIEPRKDGPTMITARFHELKEAPGGKVYTLWAVSSDNKFVKLGQIVNTGTRNEAEIKSETTLPDFGLLITLEDEFTSPRGTVVGTVVPYGGNK